MADLDVEQLRKWVRRELSPQDRREVTRWIIRSADPTLPDVLLALSREYADEKADNALRGRSPLWERVVEMWRTLEEEGRAALDGLRPPELAGGAVLAPGDGEPGLVFRDFGDEVAIGVHLPRRARAMVMATTDAADEFQLMSWRVLQAGRVVEVERWEPEDEEGRVTVWLVLGPAGDTGPGPSTMAEVLAGQAAGRLEVYAARWFDAD